MPIYEYKCENGHVFEVIQRMADDAVTECEQCGASVQRVFHPIAVHFKGSGFYTTDYGSGKAAAGAGGDGSEKGKSDSSGSEGGKSESGKSSSGKSDSSKSDSSKSSTSKSDSSKKSDGKATTS